MIGHICNCRIPRPMGVFACGSLCNGKKVGGSWHHREPYDAKTLMALIAYIKEPSHSVCFRCLALFLGKVKTDCVLEVVEFDAIRVSQ